MGRGRSCNFMEIAAVILQLCWFLEAKSSNLGVSYNKNKINQLPDQPAVRFQQFSGYITVDVKSQRNLFYYFVEAETDPSSKPLVLWLNGGPGCSSVGVGAFSENGPFKPRGKLLFRNQYSWNKVANMLYVETPAGVGFSYSNDASYYSYVNDSMTARDNLIFFQQWLKEFPEFKDRDLFLTGESYAGHYIPQLAQLMIQSNKKEKIINIKGVALGNPLLEFTTDMDSKAEFLWSHGVISDSTYNDFTSKCNYSNYLREHFRGALSLDCAEVISQVTRETSQFVDRYDLTLDVCLPSASSQSKFLSPQQKMEIDVCVEDEASNYLNRKDVQNSLHARLVGVTEWTTCSSVLEYDQLNMEIPTISILQLLAESGVRVVIYSGDQDSVIPLTGTRKLVHGLAQQLQFNTSVPYRVWFAAKQVGGWTQVYGNLLTFATIRGASHEAPFSQPERSFVLFKSFLEGRPLPYSFPI